MQNLPDLGHIQWMLTRTDICPPEYKEALIMAEPDKCRHGRLQKGDTTLNDHNLDVVDFGFLTAARYFCVSFSSPHSDAWVFAMLVPERFFPGPDSAEMMRRALAVVQEMRTSRRSTFRFSNPRCECCANVVTQDERHLLQLVQHARAGKRSHAASSAMLLCEGHDTADTILAAYQFAQAVGSSRLTNVTA